MTKAGACTTFDTELDSSAAGILHGIARDLGRGRRDARLVELGKAEKCRDLRGLAAGPARRRISARTSRFKRGMLMLSPPLADATTRIVTSSRPRLWSR